MITAETSSLRATDGRNGISHSVKNLRRPRGVILIFLSLTLWVPFIGCGDRDGAPGPSENGTAPILLFNGIGTSPNDVAAFEEILKNHQAEFATVNSKQLNAMTAAQLREHRLLIIPGGNFIKMGRGLTTNATANVRLAVQGGMNYLGVCAGAFMAGNSPFNGVNLTSGIKFGFYSAEDNGVRKAAVAITVARAPTLEHYWEDGPQLAGWGDVVGKYPDGFPAIVESPCANGWVILSGVHPEAPDRWRRGMGFNTPTRDDNEYAWTLIQAARDRVNLPHY